MLESAATPHRARYACRLENNMPAACAGSCALALLTDAAHPGAVRFGGQGPLAQTIRPRKVGGADLPPELDLPEGEPVSPPGSGSDSDDEEGIPGSGDDPREGLDHNATAGSFSLLLRH